MVTVKQLMEKLQLTQLTNCKNLDTKISDGCVCDLLSWVMARGEADMAWVTVQTHLNVVAVACLHDFACVIIPENIEVPQSTIKKADEEELVLLSSDKTSYHICCEMFEAGVKK